MGQHGDFAIAILRLSDILNTVENKNKRMIQEVYNEYVVINKKGINDSSYQSLCQMPECLAATRMSISLNSILQIPCKKHFHK